MILLANRRQQADNTFLKNAPLAPRISGKFLTFYFEVFDHICAPEPVFLPVSRLWKGHAVFITPNISSLNPSSLKRGEGQ